MRGGRLAENRRHNTVEYVHRRTLAHWATSSEPHIISRASLRCRVLSSYAGGVRLSKILSASGRRYRSSATAEDFLRPSNSCEACKAFCIVLRERWPQGSGSFSGANLLRRCAADPSPVTSRTRAFPTNLKLTRKGTKPRQKKRVRAQIISFSG